VFGEPSAEITSQRTAEGVENHVINGSLVGKLGVDVTDGRSGEVENRLALRSREISHDSSHSLGLNTPRVNIDEDALGPGSAVVAERAVLLVSDEAAEGVLDVTPAALPGNGSVMVTVMSNLSAVATPTSLLPL